jgi:hypothetical protein
MYIQASSHHHSLQNSAVLFTVIWRAKTTRHLESFDGEIQHLKKTFWQKRYNTVGMHWALNLRQKSLSQQERPSRKATIPYMQTTSDRLSRLMAMFNAHFDQKEWSPVETCARWPRPQGPKRILYLMWMKQDVRLAGMTHHCNKM